MEPTHSKHSAKVTLNHQATGLRILDQSASLLTPSIQPKQPCVWLQVPTSSKDLKLPSGFSLCNMPANSRVDHISNFKTYANYQAGHLQTYELPENSQVSDTWPDLPRLTTRTSIIKKRPFCKACPELSHASSTAKKSDLPALTSSKIRWHWWRMPLCFACLLLYPFLKGVFVKGK